MKRGACAHFSDMGRTLQGKCDRQRSRLQMGGLFSRLEECSGRGVKAQCTSVASEPKLLPVLQVPTLSFILRVMFVKGTWGFQGSQDIPMTVLCLLEASSVSFLF